MSWFPTPLFNPLTAPTPLSPTEIFAGPFGLIAFLPLVPAVWLIAQYSRPAAIISTSLIWLLVTLQPAATGVLVGGLLVAVGWLMLLRWLRRRQHISQRAMVGAVWIGLHVLVLPLWWQAQNLAWYPSRMQALHTVGFAYLLLRLIAWGVALAREPAAPLRLVDTFCWLLYPPVMRLGPVVLRETFLARYDAWEPWRGIAWIAGLKRFGLFILGGAALGFVGNQLPHVPANGADFFASPEQYRTSELVRVFYLVPIQVYFILWTYNELAATLGYWLGLRVDNNFDWLPRATSVRDFWRRWHITLGAWLRNYIYIPLGGNRRHQTLNYAAVFGYCGVWHGPAWSFVGWAATQVAALKVQREWDRLRQRVRWLQVLRGPGWVATCWLLTLHYQLATVLLFVDFEHLGLRVFGELLRRVA